MAGQVVACVHCQGRFQLPMPMAIKEPPVATPVATPVVQQQLPVVQQHSSGQSHSSGSRRRRSSAPKSKKAPYLTASIVIPGIFIGAFMALVLLGVMAGDSDSSTDSTISATVNFSRTEVKITNNDTFHWTKVKLKINGSYVLNKQFIRAGEIVIVHKNDFATSGGERFNVLTMKMQNLSISCDTPQGHGFEYLEPK
ncbi:MAG: hypothetical protein COA78_26235 [Blastopirellula sp.]|nr:MAG: hypothetical protein COA78_26235 [Blastopirellula sp.]